MYSTISHSGAGSVHLNPSSASSSSCGCLFLFLLTFKCPLSKLYPWTIAYIHWNILSGQDTAPQVWTARTCPRRAAVRSSTVAGVHREGPYSLRGSSFGLIRSLRGCNALLSRPPLRHHHSRRFGVQQQGMHLVD